MLLDHIIVTRVLVGPICITENNFSNFCLVPRVSVHDR